MHRTACAALALLANLIALSPAAASGLDAHQPEARLSWRLGFGGPDARLQTGYGLAVDIRAPGFEDQRATLAELDVTDAAALARLAGLPLYSRGWRLNQAEGGDAGQAAAQPWFARQWVWWTVGGAALSAAVASGGSGDQAYCAGDCDSDGGNGGGGDGGVTGVGIDDDGAHVGCVNGDCVVCPNGDVASHCPPSLVPARSSAVAASPEFASWLDAGTGGMGDLVAR